jgi:hypothetical protein
MALDLGDPVNLCPDLRTPIWGAFLESLEWGLHIKLYDFLYEGLDATIPLFPEGFNPPEDL